MMDKEEIRERVTDAEKMVDLLASVPEDQRDLARLALTFYASGVSAGIALNAAPA